MDVNNDDGDNNGKMATLHCIRTFHKPQRKIWTYIIYMWRNNGDSNFYNACTDYLKVRLPKKNSENIFSL
jgi:hypothetical protein